MPRPMDESVDPKVRIRWVGQNEADTHRCKALRIGDLRSARAWARVAKGEIVCLHAYSRSAKRRGRVTWATLICGPEASLLRLHSPLGRHALPEKIEQAIRSILVKMIDMWITEFSKSPASSKTGQGCCSFDIKVTVSVEDAGLILEPLPSVGNAEEIRERLLDRIDRWVAALFAAVREIDHGVGRRGVFLGFGGTLEAGSSLN